MEHRGQGHYYFKDVEAYSKLSYISDSSSHSRPSRPRALGEHQKRSSSPPAQDPQDPELQKSTQKRLHSPLARDPELHNNMELRPPYPPALIPEL
jgi:hypothetical protein